MRHAEQRDEGGKDLEAHDVIDVDGLDVAVGTFGTDTAQVGEVGEVGESEGTLLLAEFGVGLVHLRTGPHDGRYDGLNAGGEDTLELFLYVSI